MRVGALLLVAGTALGTELGAQVPFDGCMDRQSRPIHGVIDNAIPYDGIATIRADGTPVIFYNRSRLSHTSPQGRHFIYLHECGHHKLRHVWKNPSSVRETEADCWAVQHMVEYHMIEKRHLDRLQAEIGLGRGIGSLKGCVDIKLDRDLWRRRLDLLRLAGMDDFAAIRGDAIPEARVPGYFESTLDLPGTFSCELTPEDSFTCVIFEGRDDADMSRRFDVVRSLIGDWLPEGWLTFERTLGRTTELRRFVVQEIDSGSLLTLVGTSDFRIIFSYEPGDLARTSRR